jgi:hypothetical protein
MFDARPVRKAAVHFPLSLCQPGRPQNPLPKAPRTPDGHDIKASGACIHLSLTRTCHLTYHVSQSARSSFTRRPVRVPEACAAPDRSPTRSSTASAGHAARRRTFPSRALALGTRRRAPSRGQQGWRDMPIRKLGELNIIPRPDPARPRPQTIVIPYEAVHVALDGRREFVIPGAARIPGRGLAGCSAVCCRRGPIPRSRNTTS